MVKTHHVVPDGSGTDQLAARREKSDRQAKDEVPSTQQGDKEGKRLRNFGF